MQPSFETIVSEVVPLCLRLCNFHIYANSIESVYHQSVDDVSGFPYEKLITLLRKINDDLSGRTYDRWDEELSVAMFGRLKVITSNVFGPILVGDNESHADLAKEVIRLRAVLPGYVTAGFDLKDFFNKLERYS